MNETPLPFMVSAIMANGLVLSFLEAREESIISISCPSIFNTSQPKALNFASRSPKSETSLT